MFAASSLFARALLQAAYLIMVSRWLGPSGYGAFAGSAALAILLSTLSAWGAAFVISSRVGRDAASLGPVWSSVLLQVCIVGSLLVPAFVLLTQTAISVELTARAALLIAVSELIAMPASTLAITACLAAGRGSAVAVVTVLLPVARVTSAGSFLLMGAPGDVDYAALSHCIGSLAAAIAACTVVAWSGGRLSSKGRVPLRQMYIEGAPYAAGGAVGVGYLEIDKVLILGFLGASLAGQYTAAFRIASIFILPISALTAAALPRLYALAGSDAGQPLHRALLLATGAYCVGASIVALVCAPLLPHVLGQAFAAAVPYALGLAGWILPFGLRQYFASLLTTSGRQKSRVAIESMGLAVMLLINVLYLETLGLLAAVIALISAEVLMAACCALKLHFDRRGAAPSS